MSHLKYEVLLFDVDDTLFDFGKSEEKAFHHTFVDFGYPTGFTDYRTDYQAISKVLWNDLEEGRMTLRELGIERFKRLIELHKLDINAQEISRVYLEYLGQETHLIEGVIELFDQLHNYRLGVVTNGFTTVQKARIANSPLHNRFEHITMSEEAGYQKPDQRIFDYTLEQMQITDKSKVLMVGDSLTSDIQGGLKYGIDTCWFNPAGKKNCTSYQPTYEVQELQGIMKIIEGRS